MTDPSILIARAESLVGRLEKLVPAEAAPTNWKASIAFRWRKRDGRGAIVRDDERRRAPRGGTAQRQVTVEPRREIRRRGLAGTAGEQRRGEDKFRDHRALRTNGVQIGRL